MFDFFKKLFGPTHIDVLPIKEEFKKLLNLYFDPVLHTKILISDFDQQKKKLLVTCQNEDICHNLNQRKQFFCEKIAQNLNLAYPIDIEFTLKK